MMRRKHGLMLCPRLRRVWLNALLAASTLGLAGCDLLVKEAKVYVAITHHATRTPEGVLPDYGEPDFPRTFVNDLGWEVTLAEGVVVHTAAQIESCEGEAFDMAMPHGPLPEYQLDRDQMQSDFATVNLPEGTYCKLRVEYGRYLRATAEAAEDTPHELKGHTELEGVTVYLAGTADKLDGAGESINWGFKTSETTIVELDLSTIENGRPFTVTGDEPNGKFMTVAKTYDAFFRGVDFAALDDAAIEASLLETLSAETYVVLGSRLN